MTSLQLNGKLSQFWHNVQSNLFPWLGEELGPLRDAHRRIITVLEMARIEEFVTPYRGETPGRPPACRAAIARAFVAKAVLNLPTTRQLLDRLRVDKTLRRICGWERLSEIPDESVFSRAFREFAEDKIPERVHEAMIKTYRSDCLVGHLSRDSTAIVGREQCVFQKKKVPKIKRPPGRPKKGEVPEKVEETRIQRQLEMNSVDEMLADLPKTCDVGTKVDSKGHKISWRGYKFHIDTADGDIPISCILTSASTHDSQVAIPLSFTSYGRVTSLYDLMDSAYDAGPLRSHSESLGHVPLIDFNHRSPKDTRAFAPHEAQRYKERSAAERVNSQLKDNFGGRFVRVRGHLKVMAHLMLGILSLTACQLVATLT